jgi:hypothetical protein
MEVCFADTPTFPRAIEQGFMEGSIRQRIVLLGKPFPVIEHPDECSILLATARKSSLETISPVTARKYCD